MALLSAGWVVVGPVYAGIEHAVYCHYRDLAQIPNEAPEDMLDKTVLQFTVPASFLPKSASPSRFGAPNLALLLWSMSFAALSATLIARRSAAQ